jgi:hypothetical protein
METSKKSPATTVAGGCVIIAIESSDPATIGQKIRMKQWSTNNSYNSAGSVDSRGVASY